MSELTVLVANDAAVRTITINRPGRHNALDLDTKIALRDELAAAAEDDSVRAVILTATGRSFCVGQDLAEHARSLATDASTAFATVTDHYSPIVTSLTTMPKPVIAGVNGTCVGAGLGLALACDLRVISSEATFSTAFAAIGLTLDSGLSYTLPRAVGEARARELLLLGQTFSAQEALAWGVPAQLCQPDALAGVCAQLAATLAAGPTAAYAAAKLLLSEGSRVPFAEALRLEAAAQQALGLTRDHQRAVAAFMEKTTPVFEGR